MVIIILMFILYRAISMTHIARTSLIQIQILLNTNVFKYKYIGKYFKYIFQIPFKYFFIFRMYYYVGKIKANYILKHLVYRHN